MSASSSSNTTSTTSISTTSNMAGVPTCPQCRGKMVCRRGAFGAFLGCVKYPHCKGTRKISTESTQTGVPVSQIKLLTGSPEQEKIWDLMKNSQHHIVVNALAGTGKTTTLIQGLARVDLAAKSYAYMAFSAAIRDEMAGRAPRGVTVIGIHQYGFRAFKAVFGNVVMENSKYAMIYEQLNPFNGEGSSEEGKLHFFTLNIVKDLIAKCQNFLLAGTTADLDWVVDHFDIEFENEEGVIVDRDFAYKMVPKCLEIGKKTTSILSFDDMLWMPVVHDIPTPTFDVVCIDEAQDLNAVQHALVMSSIRNGGRIVMVGDRNQSIYGFRGSDVDSMETLSNLLSCTQRKVEVCPLNETRRCGKKIVEAAQQYVPEFRAYSGNPEGEIINADCIDDCLQNGYITKGNMAICRFNAPIVQLAYRLISERIPVHFIGRDFGKTILTQAQKFAKKTSCVVKMHRKCLEWKENQLALLAGRAQRGQDVEKLQNLVSDKANSVLIFINEIMVRNKGIETANMQIEGNKKPLLTSFDVLAEITNFFGINNGKSDDVMHKEGHNKFRLSSVHQSKGLEAHTIVWINPDAIIKHKKAWQNLQEKNIQYVATTRAIMRLVNVVIKPRPIVG